MFRFPAIEYDKDSNEECIICTESFIKARRLPCGHHFHFFCIAKWLKKNPSKICPICRRDIFTDANNNNPLNDNRNNLLPRSFGFRIESRLFSWLPNISFRILRGPSNLFGRNTNGNNTAINNMRVGLQNLQGNLQGNLHNNPNFDNRFNNNNHNQINNSPNINW